jgi:uridine kinase
VIGITGVSRSGKGWVAEGIRQAAEAAGKRATIIAQDYFWFQACELKVHDQMRVSNEEPECINHEKFAAEIEENANTHDVVIAEGSYLVFNPLVAAQLNHIFMIDLDRDESRRRRTQPRDEKLNPNPLQVNDFDDLLWPAYERYMADKVVPLGERIVPLQSPTDAALRDELVDVIMRAAAISAKVTREESSVNEDNPDLALKVMDVAGSMVTERGQGNLDLPMAVEESMESIVTENSRSNLGRPIAIAGSMVTEHGRAYLAEATRSWDAPKEDCGETVSNETASVQMSL